MVVFYVVCVSLVLTGVVSVWILLVLLSLPHCARYGRCIRNPSPPHRPRITRWPLWFVSWAFHWTKQAGTLFVVGVVLGAIFPIRLSL